MSVNSANSDIYVYVPSQPTENTSPVANDSGLTKGEKVAMFAKTFFATLCECAVAFAVGGAAGFGAAGALLGFVTLPVVGTCVGAGACAVVGAIALGALGILVGAAVGAFEAYKAVAALSVPVNPPFDPKI